MRYSNTEHENLYKRYSSIAEKNIALSASLTKKELVNEIWRLICDEGIWYLPISKQYGGKGQSWQDCVAAFEGLLKNYFCTEIITLFISQINSLYLVSHYGTEHIKKIFLPRLMKGEIASIHISQAVMQSFNQSAKANIERKQNFIINSTINICIEKNARNKIIYCIKEKKLTVLNNVANKTATTVAFAKNKITGNEIEKIAVYDLLSVERLIYAILASQYANSISKDFLILNSKEKINV